jgi:dipeptidase E
MKLLLTSGGITNKSITNALLDLAGRPFAELKLAFIPTAADVEKGSKEWLINDLGNLKSLGFAKIDIVDISAVPRENWEPRIKEADILVFGGGNTYHLMYWLGKSGLAEILPDLLKSRVYVGISAGSMVAGCKISLSTSERLYYKEEGQYNDEKGLGFVNFLMRPHLNSSHFPKIRKEFLEETAKEIKEPIYAIDDQTAIQVVDGDIKIITEGDYLRLN